MHRKPDAIFMCREHQFVTTRRGSEISCHDSPGHRKTGCAECDKVVEDALAPLFAESSGAAPAPKVEVEP